MSSDRYMDLFQDTWAATDDLGRSLPLETGIKENKKVGIFYFMWHRGKGPLMDHSLAYAIGGIEEVEKVMASGSRGFAHYWAEPYFGYYRSDDPWVIRKHAYQLADAGVDFIFLDVTNGLIYESVCRTILEVWEQIRKEGYKTPEVMFCAGNTPELAYRSISDAWNAFFSKGLFDDLWFRWQGKPLMLAPDTTKAMFSPEQQEYFTWRKSWANTNDSWYADTNGCGAWAWADMYPQKPGKSPEGELEQMIVMCGFWVNGSYGTNAGRSFSKGKQPDNERERDYGFSLVNKTSPLGLAFQEQFDRAEEIDPPVVMITGWNEWWAGRWDTDANGFNPAQGQTIANTYKVDGKDPKRCNYFVDNFNGEYSRDIEPVKGLYNDNYYYQMVANIRKYKGCRPVPSAKGQQSIDIFGDYSVWKEVGPAYHDYAGDTAKRDFDSYVGGFHYTNDTGRNDLVLMKVSQDIDHIYFLAVCADQITSPSGTNWMNLFINADRTNSGWYGYNYIINRYRNDDGTVSVEEFRDGSFENISLVGSALMSVKGNVLQLRVSKAVLGGLADAFEFKWADNSVSDGNIMEFLDKGDCAPNGRFNYIYKNSEG